MAYMYDERGRWNFIKTSLQIWTTGVLSNPGRGRRCQTLSQVQAGAGGRGAGRDDGPQQKCRIVHRRRRRHRREVSHSVGRSANDGRVEEEVRRPHTR